MARQSFITKDTVHPDAVPYFNWDAPVTNSQVRHWLAEGTEDDKVYWIARIMTEAHFEDVWNYLSLKRDILPRWDRLRRILGRRRALWEFTIERWRHVGLLKQ